MKKILLLVAILPLVLCAQVRIAKPAKAAEKAAIPYDSTFLICEKRIEKLKGYIGQEFFVMPKSEALQRIGYDLTREKKKYSHGDIPYAELAEKTLRVVDATFGGADEYDSNYYLTFINKDGNDTLYWKYETSKYHFPFLILGYKDKFEKKYKGKTFLFRGVERDDIADFTTGNYVHLTPCSRWVFEEIVIVPLCGDLSDVRYLCSNAKGEHVAFNEDFIVEKAKMDKLSRKYGQRLCNLAMNLKIGIGMPKELVKLAWGEPDKINDTSYSDQWVYGRNGEQCVYFRNGKVTAWN